MGAKAWRDRTHEAARVWGAVKPQGFFWEAPAGKPRTRLMGAITRWDRQRGGTRLERGETIRLLLGRPRGQVAHAPRGAKAW